MTKKEKKQLANAHDDWLAAKRIISDLLGEIGIFPESRRDQLATALLARLAQANLILERVDA